MSRPTHDLKSWVGLFEPILRGDKTHDLRVLDRDYQIGDHCLLREWDPLKRVYTGRETEVEITYITSSQHQECAFSPMALHPATAILSIRRVSAAASSIDSFNRPDMDNAGERPDVSSLSSIDYSDSALCWRAIRIMLCLMGGLVFALSLIILFVPEPYADWLKQWAILGFVMCGMWGEPLRWPWALIFGPHIAASFGLFRLWEKMRS